MRMSTALACLGLMMVTTAPAWAHDDETSSSSPAITANCDSCQYFTSLHDHHENRPDDHAPAGLMGDHVHDRGEFMFEYKFSGMYMDDNRVGTRTVGDVAALDASGVSFMATPTQMTMNMHMFHLMYGVTDNITAYFMPMWMGVSMDHLRRNGTTFRSYNEGFGDTGLGALYRIHDGENDDLILNLGFTVPTGNLTNRTNAPTNGSPGLEFPYPMRLGSGTFDARPGITYKRYWEKASFGAQFQTDLPIGTNFDGYSVGNEYAANLWTSLRPVKNLSFSYRVEFLWRENFSGQDNDLLNPNLISTIRPDMRGGEWINFGYGGVWQLPDGSRINVELTHPIHQDLDGIQLEMDWSVFASWSKAF